ncbi:hypothetical protein T440DRAFT_522949 [Plenodomus tracheiphilus IPT5]|uniref:Uncharacterized protein n=1 Tax=Plenodomus tracheiphilus IPT5 TaxID=1408161 RepID=A0A6A7AQV4_9PLEO|nr:hypothetical protein T440DRAFT_522949 [Plenodomus tracheiphilus IPT5]
MTNPHSHPRQLEAAMKHLADEFGNLQSSATRATTQRDDLNRRVINLESVIIIERMQQFELANRIREQREQVLLNRVLILEQRTKEQATDIARLNGNASRRHRAGIDADTIATALPPETEPCSTNENVTYIPFALEEIAYQFGVRKDSGRIW